MEIDFKSYKTWEIIATIVAVIIIALFVFPPSCSGSYSNDSYNSSMIDDSSLAGTYTYVDAVGHEFLFEAKADGTATVRMTSEPTSELDRIAYSNERNGSEGTWMQSSLMRGNDVFVPYFHAIIEGEDLYFCEGYVYSSYSNMEMRNKSAGNPYKKIK